MQTILTSANEIKKQHLNMHAIIVNKALKFKTEFSKKIKKKLINKKKKKRKCVENSF